MPNPLPKNLLSTVEAAKIAKCTSGYITKLCRSGKLEGTRIGKEWHVEESVLSAHLLRTEGEKEARRKELSLSREQEYRSNLLSTEKVARLADCTPGYVSGLCRSGKLVATKTDKGWYVKPVDLQIYLAAVEEEKKNLRTGLSKKREAEYRTHQSATEIPALIVSPYAAMNAGSFRRHAKTLAVFVLFIGALALGVSSQHPVFPVFVNAPGMDVRVGEPTDGTAPFVTLDTQPAAALLATIRITNDPVDFGKELALYTYETIHGAYVGMSRSLLALLPSSNVKIITLQPILPSASKPASSAATSSAVATTITQHVTRNTIQNITNQFYTEGASIAYVDASIGALRTFVLKQAGSIVRSNSGGGGNGGNGNSVVTSTASGLPGGTSGELQFNDNGVLGGASALVWDPVNNRLTLSATAGGLLKTDASGAVSLAASGTDYVATTTGDWIGTFNGLSGAGYLANSFSTTSASYFLSQNTGASFSTTSSDYWFGTKTTDALAEGISNLYWTANRFDNRLSATTSLPNITTLANLGTVSTALTGILHASAGVLSAGSVLLASEVSGILPVSNGGTGSTTLSGLLKGNGTGSILSAIAGTDYQIPGAYITALTGDIAASGPGSAVATLATVNTNVGSFGGASLVPTFTVNGKGLITAAGSVAVIAPAGTLSGTSLAANVVSSSLTSVGTLTSLTIGSLSGLLYGNSGAVAAASVTSPLSFSAGTLSISNAAADGVTKGAATFVAADFNDASGLLSIDYANGQKATGSVPGFLSAADWTTFNGKQAALTFTYPLQDSTNIVSLAFGTTTANSWNALQTFTGGITTAGTVTLGSLSGVLHAASGVVSASNVLLGSEVTGTLPVSNGGTGVTSFTSSQLLYGNGTGALSSVATSSLSLGTGLDLSAGSLGYQIDGTNVTIKLANTAVTIGSYGGASSVPTFTVDQQGRITVAGSVAVIAPAGTLSGTSLASNVVSSSLTSVGTLTSLTVSGLSTLAAATFTNATSTNFFAGTLTANTASFGGTASTTIASTGVITTPGIIDSSQTAGSLLYSNASKQNSSVTLPSYVTLTSGLLAISALPNAQLANSTISGIALGGTLGTLTFGTHLTSGASSYNGSTGATITTDATDLNTASTIVARDGSGNFSAGTITATLNGSAPAGTLSGTTLASNVVSSSLTSVGTLSSLTIGTLSGVLHAASGVVSASNVLLGSEVTGVLPSANGGTGWASVLSGAILYGNGSSALATTTAGINGQVLSLVGGIPTWQATSTLATISGTLSGTQLDGVFGTNGILARTTTGTYASRTLTGTSNRLTVTNGDGVAGNPTFDISSSYVGQSTITTLGTIATGIWNGTAIDATHGGTGATTVTTGDLLYGSAANIWSKLADVATGNVLISGGVSAAPSWGKVALASAVSGTLPIANGGTATTTFQNGGVTFYNSSLGTLSQGTAASDFFYDVTNKRLGLGTSTPWAQLSINPNGITGPSFVIGSSTATNFVVTNAGNVGIGTSLPAGLFDVVSLVSDVAPVMTSNSTPSPYVAAASGSVNGSNLPYQAFDNNFTNSQWASNTSTGWVSMDFGSGNGKIINQYQLTGAVAGLETLAPKSWTFEGSNDNSSWIILDTQSGAPVWTALESRNYTFSNHVSYRYYRLNISLNQGGTWAGVVELRMYQGGTHNLTVLSTTGNVGIGTTSPSSLLSVAGGASIGADYNIAAPTNGLIVEGNVGIGTTSPSYKLDVAGFINTDQYSGYKQAGNTVLYASTTNQSLAVGASGAAAWMAATSSAFYDVAIGQGALSATPTSGTAQYNSAMGAYSLDANTTGSSNSAVGMNALTFNTTGSNNSALGTNALYHNTTGANNSAMGVNALYSNTTGSSNTLLGYQSGYDITTGSNNLVLGTEQTTGTGITTGSNNILLGNSVSSGLSQTGSNQLNIGNLIFGTSVGTGSTLSTGNVGIGTSTPWAQLSINPNGITGPAFAIGSSTATKFLVTNAGKIAIGSTTANHLLDVNGNIGLAASSYINWGNADGTSGYGFRDNAGILEFKNAGGAWGSIASTTGPVSVFSVVNGTTNSTYTVPTGSNYAYTVVELWGAGGGGGGGSTDATQATCPNNNSGGGGGAYVKRTFVVGSITGTVTVTVGGGGSGGSAGCNSGSGSAGGSSSFSTITAGGGAGGGGTNTATAAGGTASGGDTNTSGGGSSTSLGGSGAAPNTTYGGTGAGGGVGVGAGTAGTIFGGGGGPGGRASTGGATVGAVGASGGYVITTYIYTSATNLTGIQGQIPFYNAAGTSLTATSSIFLAQSGNVGIGTTAPGAMLNVFSTDTTSPVKAIFGATTTPVTLYSTFNSQSNTALELSANAASGTGGAHFILSNDIAASSLTAGTALGSLDFAAPGTGSAEKRGAAISSTLTATGSSNLTADLKFFTNNAGTLGQVMEITGAGNVGIGTTTPSAILDVNGGQMRILGGATYGVIPSTGKGLILGYDTTADNGLILSYNSGTATYKTLELRGAPLILNTTGGNVGIGGTPTTGAKLDVTGAMTVSSNANVNIISVLNAPAAGSSAACVSGTGAYVTGYATIGSCSSDARLKHDIISLSEGALSKILSLRPVDFVWNGDASSTVHAGFIAQETMPYVGEAIGTTSNNYYSFDSNAVLSYTVKAIQEMNKIVSFAAASTSQPSISILENSNVGIGTIAPTSKLSVSGSVSATSYSIQGAGQQFSAAFSALTFGSTTAMSVLSIDGQNVDIYKLATFALTGVQQLAAQQTELMARTDSIATEVDSLSARVAALESGATAGLQSAATTATSSPLSATTTQLASAFEAFGLSLQNGIASATQMIIGRLTIGSHDKPSGVTIYDEVTGDPYCLSVHNGAQQVKAGECPIIDLTAQNNPGLVSAPVSTATSTATTTPIATSAATSTPASAPATPSDTTPPVVSLVGAAAINVTQGGVWIDPGATALDDTDGDLTSSIAVSGSIDTATPGTYTLQYSATDKAGNVGQVSRTVVVIATVVVAPPPVDSTATPPVPAP